MIKPLWDPFRGSRCPQSAKNGKTTWHCIETILCGKVHGYYAYWHPKFWKLEISLLLRKLRIFCKFWFKNFLIVIFRFLWKFWVEFWYNMCSGVNWTQWPPRGHWGSLNIRTCYAPNFHSKFSQEWEYHV